MNFEIVNAKTQNFIDLKKNYSNMAYLFTEIVIISWHTQI